MRIRINKRICFYALLALLFVLLMVRYGLQIEIPRIAVTIVILAIAAIGTNNEIFAITMSCIPLHEAVDFFYALVGCALVYLVKNYKRIRVNFSAVLILAMAVWELLHCFGESFSVRSYLGSIIPLLFLLVVMSSRCDEIDYGFVVRTMSVVTIVASFMLLLYVITIADFNIELAIMNLRRLGVIADSAADDVMQGTAINPNTLGIICVISLTGLLQLRLANKNRIIDIILMILLLVLGTLTASRTYFVCLMLMAFLFIIGHKGTVKKKIGFIIFIILFAVVALFLINFVFPELFQYFVGRFTVDDITTGRDVLMLKYHGFIMDNPSVLLFGIGLNDYGHMLTEVYRIGSVVPHNSIQEIIIAWGIPGLSIFVTLCYVLVINAKRVNNKPILLNYIPFFIIIVKSMAGQLLTSNYSMLALAFAFLSMCQRFNQTNILTDKNSIEAVKDLKEQYCLGDHESV